MQGCFNIQKSINIIHHFKRLKKKNHVILSIEAEKHLTKFNTHSLYKALSKLEVEEKLHQLDKEYLQIIYN